MHKKEQIDKLLKCISLGASYTDSCKASNISEQWFYKERKNNSDFAKRVSESKADLVIRNLAIIQNAAAGTWQAAAWLLERLRSNEFSLKNSLKLEGGVEIIKINKDLVSKDDD